jgi:hypothetical protein
VWGSQTAAVRPAGGDACLSDMLKCEACCMGLPSVLSWEDAGRASPAEEVLTPARRSCCIAVMASMLVLLAISQDGGPCRNRDRQDDTCMHQGDHLYARAWTDVTACHWVASMDRLSPPGCPSTRPSKLARLAHAACRGTLLAGRNHTTVWTMPLPDSRTRGHQHAVPCDLRDTPVPRSWPCKALHGPVMLI